MLFQVTQAILEFEEGNQGIIDRLNPVGMEGQLGDGSIGQLGHPEGDGQGHGHSLLQGEDLLAASFHARYLCEAVLNMADVA